MTSHAQIEANRLNSQKSTGPTSPEGKAASSLNALKSGIHATSHIIPGENPAELAALTAAFLLEFQPADPNQLALVDTLIAAEWTQRRLRRIEAELWNSRDESLDPTYAEISDTPPNPCTRPCRTKVESSGSHQSRKFRFCGSACDPHGMFAQPCRGRAWCGCPKPRRRSWLRKQSVRGPPTAITIRVVLTGRRRGPFVSWTTHCYW